MESYPSKNLEIKKVDMLCFYTDTATSTMDLARDMIRSLSKISLKQKSFAVFCRHQTQGRGRQGTVWQQGPLEKNNLITNTDAFPSSWVFHRDQVVVPLTWVSLCVACAVHDAISHIQRISKKNLEENLFPQDFLVIKWPNDLLLKKDQGFLKMAGILCEVRSDYLIVGIGVNVFAAPDVPTACSLFPTSCQFFNGFKAHIIKNLFLHIENKLKFYLTHSWPTSVLQDFFLKRSLPIGTKLSVEKNTKQGAFLGISAQGGLLLEGHDQPLFSAVVDVVL